MTRVVDVFVGARVRNTRKFRGLDLTDVAFALKIPPDQLERCENGLERFPVRQLVEIGKLLDVEPFFFFYGLRNHSFARDTDAEIVRRAANDNADELESSLKIRIVCAV